MTTDDPNSGGHAPVMLTEVLAALEPGRGGVFLDATFGGGGYTQALLATPEVSVVALDRDPDAIRRGQPLVDRYAGRLTLIRSAFSEIGELAARHFPDGLDGLVLDIGVSSFQIDQAERGFSFMADGPLDMRMDKEGISAAEALAHASETQLADVLFHLGEEPDARRLAKAILAQRRLEPIETTARLADVVSDAVGGRKGQRTHPATRVFQALRIWINDELGELARALEAAERVLKPGGRLVVVSFHSLEDRMVKTFLRERSGETGEGSRHMPSASMDPAPSFALVGRSAVLPSEAETEVNPRARSARLRVGVRTAAAAWGRSVDAGVPDLPLSFREG